MRTDRERRIAFAVTVAVIAGVVALLSLTRNPRPPAPDPPAEQPRPAHGQASPAAPDAPARRSAAAIVVDAGSGADEEQPLPPTQRTGALPPGPRPEEGARPPCGSPDGPADVVAAARRFVEAYLTYELGETGPSQRRAISRATGEPLRSRLLDDPPRAPLGAPLRRAQLLWIDGVTPRRVDGRRGYDVSLVVRRGRGREVHMVTVTKENGRWLVTDLRA